MRQTGPRLTRLQINVSARRREMRPEHKQNWIACMARDIQKFSATRHVESLRILQILRHTGEYSGILYTTVQASREQNASDTSLWLQWYSFESFKSYGAFDSIVCA